jgi:hypothetical protein
MRQWKHCEHVWVEEKHLSIHSPGGRKQKFQELELADDDHAIAELSWSA